MPDRFRPKFLAMAALAVVIGLGLGLTVAEVGLRWMRSSAENPGSMEPGLFQYDSRLGWAITPGARIRHRHNDFEVVYTANADGHRGARASSADPEARTVVWLGDSYTFGFGAEDQDIFTEVLNRGSERDTLHVNLAVPGTSTDQQILLAEERAFQLRPDLIVLVVYLGNDLIDNMLPFPVQASTAKPYFEMDGSQLALRNVPVPRTPKPTDLRQTTFSSVVLGDHRPDRGWLGRSEILRRLGWRPATADISADFEPRLTPSLDMFAALVRRLQTAADLHGTRLAVAVLPGKSFVEDPRGYSGQYQEWARRGILERLAELDVPALDLATRLREARADGQRDLFHPNEGHLSAAGHAFVAHQVADALPGLVLRRSMRPRTDAAVGLYGTPWQGTGHRRYHRLDSPLAINGTRS